MTNVAAPFDMSEMTSEWLGLALASTGTIGQPDDILAIEIHPTAKAGLTSVTSRVDITYRAGRTGPTSLISKLPSPDPGWRKMTNRARIFERGAGFYREIQSRFPLRTPTCYFESIDYENDRCILLLEEFTDLESIDEAVGISFEQASIALGALASVHAEFWMDATLRDSAYLLTVMAPDPRQYKSSFDRARTVFSAVLDETGEQIGNRFGEDPSGLYRKICEAPPTWVHNDFRLDNLFFGPNGDVALIDFQGCTFSSPMIDLALFITLSFESIDRRRFERDLIKLYRSELLRQGVDYELDRLLEDYRAGVLYLWPRIIIPAGAAADPSDERLFGVLSGMVSRAQDVLDEHDCLALLD